MSSRGVLLSLALLAVLSTASFAAGDSPATLAGFVHSLSDMASVPAEGAIQPSQPIVMTCADQIDQNQPSYNTYMAGFSQTCLAQSFVQTHDNVSGAGIMLYSGQGSSDNVTIQLWTNLPNAGGTLLAEASATGTAGSWVDVYWDAVPVSAGITYFLVFTGNYSLGINGDTTNPYPLGCVYANEGYMQFSEYDYTFRTYYDDETSLDSRTWAGVKSAF